LGFEPGAEKGHPTVVASSNPNSFSGRLASPHSQGRGIEISLDIAELSSLSRMRGSRARLRRLVSAPIMSTICRRRATSSARARICSSGIGLGSGRTCSAKRAITSASSRSLLARRPIALA
jgi:hypothetical protein